MFAYTSFAKSFLMRSVIMRFGPGLSAWSFETRIQSFRKGTCIARRSTGAEDATFPFQHEIALHYSPLLPDREFFPLPLPSYPYGL